MDSHRRHVLRSVAALLEVLDGETPSKFTITIDTGETTIIIQPREDELAVGDLPEAQQLILDQFMLGQILTRDQIARLTGYKDNSKLRGHLSTLVKGGFLAVVADGYRRVTGGGDRVSPGVVTGDENLR